MKVLAQNHPFYPFSPVRKPPKDCQTFGKSLLERYGKTGSLSVPFEEFGRSKLHARSVRTLFSLRPHAVFAPNESCFPLLFLQIAQKSEHDFRQVFLTSEHTAKRAVQQKIEKKASMSCHKFHLLLVIKTKNDMKIGEFTSRIARLRPQMVAVARQLTDDAATAEDMVQEALLSLWDRRRELDHHPNPEALAMTMVRNKCIDHRRRVAVELKIMQGVRADAPPSALEEPRSDTELIACIIEQLPPLQARIFRLKEIEGYEKEEIMQITGCTDEALRQNLSRARRRIREEYIRLTHYKART